MTRPLASGDYVWWDSPRLLAEVRNDIYVCGVDFVFMGKLFSWEFSMNLSVPRGRLKMAAFQEMSEDLLSNIQEYSPCISSLWRWSFHCIWKVLWISSFAAFFRVSMLVVGELPFVLEISQIQQILW